MSSGGTRHGEVIRSGLLQKVFISCLFGMVLVGGDECEDNMLLLLRTEECLHRMAEQNNATMLGALKKESWRNACTLYNVTLKCIENVFDGCPEQAKELLVEEIVFIALRNGMGQLCDSTDTYKRYFLHAKCYAGQEMGTIRCVNTFFRAIHYHIGPGSSTERNLSESDQGMCRSYTALIECVHTIIGTNCGDDALALFENLVKSLVPSPVISECYTQEETEVPSNASRRISKWTIIQLVAFLFLYPRFS